MGSPKIDPQNPDARAGSFSKVAFANLQKKRPTDRASPKTGEKNPDYNGEKPLEKHSRNVFYFRDLYASDS